MTYEEAINEIYCINFLGNPDHSKPLETILKAMAWEAEIALDPKISLCAVELIKKYGGEV